MEVNYVYKNGVGWVPDQRTVIEEKEIKVGDVIVGWYYDSGDYKESLSVFTGKPLPQTVTHIWGKAVYTKEHGDSVFHVIGKPTASGRGLLTHFVIQ